MLTVVLALAILAVWSRRSPLSAPLWIDEGLSIGIASHPLGEIPHLLRLDGSPPLFYVLLHAWMSVFGRTEAATHGFALTCALLAVPAAWWAARPLGEMSGLLCAAIIALNPFTGLYADETRMYTLVLLLALLATGAFIRTFLDGRRRQAVLLAVLLAAVLYTHAWGAFLSLAAGIGWLGLLAVGPDRRRLLIDGVIAFGGALVLFAPWVPTLIDQTAHTGAPWSHRPSPNSLVDSLGRVLGGRDAAVLLLVVGLGLLAERVRSGGPRDRRAALTVLLIAALTLLVAWEWSRVQQPAWALRYLIIVLAPLAVALAIGLARAPLVGVAVVAVVFFARWDGHPPPKLLGHKSNVQQVARTLRPAVPPGTVVLSIQPEQVSNIAYYLRRRVRFVTPLGPVRDPGVTDWRDAMRRLRAARYGKVVPPVVQALAPGQRLLLVAPRFRHADAPWTAKLKRMAAEWEGHLRGSRFLRAVRTVKPKRSFNRSTVKAVLFVRRDVHVSRHRKHSPRRTRRPG